MTTLPRGQSLRKSRQHPPPSEGETLAASSSWPLITGWQLALWLLIVFRVGLELVGLISVHLLPINTINGDWVNLVAWNSALSTRWFSIWQRWDALWYQEIVTHGYHAGNHTSHFEPLFPLLSRIVSIPLFGHIVPAELLVSSAAFCVAMALLYRVTGIETGQPMIALLTVLLVVFSPTGFFFLAPYTEGLYLSLALASLYFARQERFWLAGLAAGFAALTRIFGVFLVLPLAFEYFRRRRERNERPRLEGLSVLLPALAYLLFTLYIRVIVGEHQGALEDSRYWHNTIIAPWQTVSDGLAYLTNTGNPIELLSLVLVLLFVVLAIFTARRLPLLYTLYVLPNLAILFFLDQLPAALMSDNRYLLVLFPCWIMLAIWLARRWWLAAGWLTLGLMLQMAVFSYWLHFGFVA